MEIVVRPATPPDVPRVAEIMVEGFGSEFDHIFGRQVDRAPCVMTQLCGLWLERGITVQLVAEADGQVAGMLQLSGRGERLDDLWEQARIALRELGLVYTLRSTIGLALPYQAETEGTAYISDLAVDARFRGRGIGSALLAGAEAWARKQGREGLSLHVAESNPARRLYERFGFRLEKRSKSRLAERLLGIRTWLYMIKPLQEE